MVESENTHSVLDSIEGKYHHLKEEIAHFQSLKEDIQRLHQENEQIAKKFRTLQSAVSFLLQSEFQTASLRAKVKLTEEIENIVKKMEA